MGVRSSFFKFFLFSMFENDKEACLLNEEVQLEFVKVDKEKITLHPKVKLKQKLMNIFRV